MSSPVEEQARILVATAGGYLRNVIRAPGITCPTCTTPVYAPYTVCLKCTQDRGVVGKADLVVPLSYAIARAQSGLMMRHYKDDGSADVRERHTAVVRRLMYLGIMQHEDCIGRVVGSPVDRRIAIPSSKGRTGLHPFVAMARGMRAVKDTPQLLPGSGTYGEREVTPARFSIDPAGTRFDGEHVLILDDTWTTGSRTQSAAVLLRGLGASHVSIMTAARWIEPGWSDNATFIRQRLAADFDTANCPVTGARCPE